MNKQVRENVAQVGASGSLNGGFVDHQPTTLTTSDATATKIFGLPVSEGEAVVVRAVVVGMKSDLSASYAGHVVLGARRAAAGNVTAVGSASITGLEDSAGTPAVTVAANTSTQEIEIKVAGIAAETWRWECKAESVKAK